MASMNYGEAAARRLEAVYMGADVAAQRQETIKRLKPMPGERVLDIGSGPGFLCQSIAERVGVSGQVRGIDISSTMVDRASRRNSLEWLGFAQGDATDLDEPDQAYDAAVSIQVAEYVADIHAFCSEFHRVLKPGGRGQIMATDWDMIAWHSDHPDRMNRVLNAFKPHCADSILPRTLGFRLAQAGFEIKAVSSYPIVNTDWNDQNYSTMMVPFLTDYIRKAGTMPDNELDAWQDELEQLANDGRYFFVTNRIIFEFERPIAD